MNFPSSSVKSLSSRVLSTCVFSPQLTNLPHSHTNSIADWCSSQQLYTHEKGHSTELHLLLRSSLTEFQAAEIWKTDVFALFSSKSSCEDLLAQLQRSFPRSIRNFQRSNQTYFQQRIVQDATLGSV
ncbi:hypothetical protein L1887_11100 [Cichorium endivia]|nr:hypothetical protein L1887_11100 [Cichorium endivia]